MKKLYCGNCYQPSDISNEQIVFCHHCGKKLQLNYTDWKHQRSFADFAAFCNEIDAENERTLAFYQIQPVKDKASARMFATFCISSVFCILACFVLLNEEHLLFSDFNPSSKDNYLNETFWHSKLINHTIGIQLPFKAEENQTRIPHHLSHYAKSLNSYKAESSGSFSVTVEEYELSGYNSEIHKEFENIQDEYTSFADATPTPLYTGETLDIKDYHATINHSTFSINNQVYLNDNYTFFNGKKGFKIMISYLRENKILTKYADIVNESILRNMI